MSKGQGQGGTQRNFLFSEKGRGHGWGETCKGRTGRKGGCDWDVKWWIKINSANRKRRYEDWQRARGRGSLLWECVSQIAQRKKKKTHPQSLKTTAAQRWSEQEDNDKHDNVKEECSRGPRPYTNYYGKSAEMRPGEILLQRAHQLVIPCQLVIPENIHRRVNWAGCFAYLEGKQNNGVCVCDMTGEVD